MAVVVVARKGASYDSRTPSRWAPDVTVYKNTFTYRCDVSFITIRERVGSKSKTSPSAMLDSTCILEIKYQGLREVGSES
jgi:hypothetical protein